MDSPSERMRDALSGIEQWLKREYPLENQGGGANHTSFTDRLYEAHRQGRLRQDDLQHLQDLWRIRGIMGHKVYEGRPPVEVSLNGLRLAEHLLERYTGKVPTLAQFDTGARSVFTTRPGERLGAVLTVMRTEDYSAVPVVDDEDRCIALLTNGDVVHWLAGHFGDGPGGIVEDVEVSAVMHEGGPDFAFIGRGRPQRDARRLFQRSADEHGAPLMALLITMTGTPNEPLLGILTPWDLPYLTPAPPEVEPD